MVTTSKKSSPENSAKAESKEVKTVSKYDVMREHLTPLLKEGGFRVDQLITKAVGLFEEKGFSVSIVSIKREILRATREVNHWKGKNKWGFRAAIDKDGFFSVKGAENNPRLKSNEQCLELSTLHKQRLNGEGENKKDDKSKPSKVQTKSRKSKSVKTVQNKKTVKAKTDKKARV